MVNPSLGKPTHLPSTITGLISGIFYTKPPYFMGKSMLSPRFPKKTNPCTLTSGTHFKNLQNISQHPLSAPLPRPKSQASRPRNSKQKASRPTRGFAECLVSVLHQENPHLKVGYFLDGCSVLPFRIKTIKFWFLWFSWQALWGFVRFGPNRSSSE